MTGAYGLQPFVKHIVIDQKKREGVGRNQNAKNTRTHIFIGESILNLLFFLI